MAVYKKFTAQDFGTVAFNAHKQYKFDSSSAGNNGISVFTSQYTSESISLYTATTSSDYNNHIKYNQLDHLYYRKFKNDHGNLFGDVHYMKNKRDLYKIANILSIPSGLYGHSIKKNTFYLSSSANTKIVDDGFGNLIVSGTNLDNYNTDIRSNLFKLNPTKGFERYDLNTIGIDPIDRNGHIVEIDHTYKLYYRKGEKRVKPIEKYSTPDFGDEYDDSYYFNHINYKDVTFRQKYLYTASLTDKYHNLHPSIQFNGSSSKVVSPNDNKYHFNPGEDFSVSFWVSLPPQSFSQSKYIICKSTTQTDVPSVTEGTAGLLKTNVTGASQPIDIEAAPQFPFEIYVHNNTDNSLGPADPTRLYTNTENGGDDTNLSTPHVYFRRSDSEKTIAISASLILASEGNTIGTQQITNNQQLQHVVCRYSSSGLMQIFVDGIAKGTSGSDNSFTKPTQNNANLYIGNKGMKPHPLPGRKGSHHFSGSLSCINIWDVALTDNEIKTHYSSSNDSPYIGNIFYSHGIATITHPYYNQRILYRGPAIFPMELSYNQSSSADIGRMEKGVFDFTFNNDGTKIYTLGSSASYTNAVLNGPTWDGSRPPNDNIPTSVTNPSQFSIRIQQFKLTTPYDTSTAVFEKQSIDLRSTKVTETETGDSYQPLLNSNSDSHGPNDIVEDRVFGLEFNDVGTKVFCTHKYTTGASPNRGHYIMELNLSGAFDVGSITPVSASHRIEQGIDDKLLNSSGNPYTGNTSGTTATFIQSLRFNNDGTRIIVGTSYAPYEGVGAPFPSFKSQTLINLLQASNLFGLSFINRNGGLIQIDLGEPYNVASAITTTKQTFHFSNPTKGGPILPIMGFGSQMQPRGFDFNDDGTEAVMLEEVYDDNASATLLGGTSGDENPFISSYLHHFKLSTPFDITTLDYNWNGPFPNASFITKDLVAGSTNLNKLIAQGTNLGDKACPLDCSIRWEKTEDGRQIIYAGKSISTGFITDGFTDVSPLQPLIGEIEGGNFDGQSNVDIITNSVRGQNFIQEYNINSRELNELKFQGTHQIFENEYQCTVDEDEFNDTLNITARKVKSSECQDLADFATGSLFKPYVTTIGLYNEHQELLVVAKLAQPIRMSNETDTTFVLRWDQ